jgi:hypothetical protein
MKSPGQRGGPGQGIMSTAPIQPEGSGRVNGSAVADRGNGRNEPPNLDGDAVIASIVRIALPGRQRLDGIGKPVDLLQIVFPFRLGAVAHRGSFAFSHGLRMHRAKAECRSVFLW